MIQTRKDQTRHHQTATIATSLESRLNSNPQRSQSLRSNTARIVPKHLKTNTHELELRARFVRRDLVRVVSACTLGLWSFAVGLLIGTFILF